MVGELNLRLSNGKMAESQSCYHKTLADGFQACICHMFACLTGVTIFIFPS